jgi:hypothetical protein
LQDRLQNAGLSTAARGIAFPLPQPEVEGEASPAELSLPPAAAPEVAAPASVVLGSVVPDAGAPVAPDGATAAPDPGVLDAPAPDTAVLAEPDPPVTASARIVASAAEVASVVLPLACPVAVSPASPPAAVVPAAGRSGARTST